MANATGGLLTSWQDPYGARRGVAPAGWVGERGFVGGTNDATGLVRIGARDYDTLLGRFVTVDPVQDLADPLQWNPYLYANNSPITKSDPSALRPVIDGDDDFVPRWRNGRTEWVWKGGRGRAVGGGSPAKGTGGSAGETPAPTPILVPGIGSARMYAQTGRMPGRAPTNEELMVLGLATLLLATVVVGCAESGFVACAGAMAEDATAGASGGSVGTGLTAAGVTGAGVALAPGAPKVPSRFITTPAGVTIDRAAVNATISVQEQARHVLGDSRYGGGSYFTSEGDAQKVLDAFHGGSAEVLGLEGSDIVVRVPGVAGFNHNPGAGYLNQPTDVFFIKGTASPSVVPYDPKWTP